MIPLGDRKLGHGANGRSSIGLGEMFSPRIFAEETKETKKAEINDNAGKLFLPRPTGERKVKWLPTQGKVGRIGNPAYFSLGADLCTSLVAKPDLILAPATPLNCFPLVCQEN